MNKDLIDDFLLRSINSSDKCNITPLRSDASLRKYYRIEKDEFSYILMYCPVDYCGIMPFVKISKYLTENKVRSPELFSYDEHNGLILMEDFGDIRMNSYMSDNKLEVFAMYKNIVDLLIYIQKLNVLPKVDLYSNEILLKELEVFFKYYYLYKFDKEIDIHKKSEFLNMFSSLLEKYDLEAKENVFVLRDFHVDNLMFIAPYTQNIRSIGVLDFQDGLIGNPIYDVVSLVDDARIDVSYDLANQIKDYYIKSYNKLDSGYFYEMYDILGMQRNLRILGVFARKFLVDKNESYLELIPRVMGYITNNMRSNVLKEFNELIDLG